MSEVAVIFERIGPYHDARLKAAGRRLSEEGIELVAIDMASSDSVYAWAEITGVVDYNRITLFPGRTYQDIPADELRRSLITSLNKLDPFAVAVPGWSSVEARASLNWCVARDKTPVLMCASTKEDFKRFFWREWIKKQIVRKFRSAVVGGERQKSYVQELGLPADRIHYGYNVVDNEFFKENAKRVIAAKGQVCHELSLPERYLLLNCRFVDAKNLIGFLRAYVQYSKTVKDPYPLVICGNGPLKKAMTTFLAKNNVEHLVKLTGFVQYPSLPAYYALADALVLPSKREPWGLVVNEAMACGLPVLVSKNCGCAPHLVRDGINGFLLEPSSVTSMCQALLQFHELPADTKDEMRKASQKIISNYGPALFAEALLKAIDLAKDADSTCISWDSAKAGSK
jgi:1,2-diacylglycerol 3-alpha-glucosyltransferase